MADVRIEITKDSIDKQLVFGWASVVETADGELVVDKEGDAMSIEELERAAYNYVLFSRVGGDEHWRTGVAVMVESVVFTKEKMAAMGLPEGILPVGWWIGFRITDSTLWEAVKQGGYQSFSVHGTGVRIPTANPASQES